MDPTRRNRFNLECSEGLYPKENPPPSNAHIESVSSGELSSSSTQLEDINPDDDYADDAYADDDATDGFITPPANKKIQFQPTELHKQALALAKMAAEKQSNKSNQNDGNM